MKLKTTLTVLYAIALMSAMAIANHPNSKCVPKTGPQCSDGLSTAGPCSERKGQKVKKDGVESWECGYGISCRGGNTSNGNICIPMSGIDCPVDKNHPENTCGKKTLTTCKYNFATKKCEEVIRIDTGGPLTRDTDEDCEISQCVLAANP